MAAPDRDAYLMEQFRALAARYEISDYYAGKLRQLEGESRGERNGERDAPLFCTVHSQQPHAVSSQAGTSH